MDFTFDSEEIFNSAFINPSDLEVSNDPINDISLSDCFLDPSGYFLATPIPRNTSNLFSPLKNSPEMLRKTILSEIDYDFDLPDSCLLFTSNENIDCDVTNIEHDRLEKLELPSLDETKSTKFNCKHVLNYIMRPLSNKLIKKINKKFKKSSVQENHQKIEPKIPIQLYSHKKRETFKCVKDQRTMAFIPNSNDHYVSKLENNFVNCGDLVTYYV